MDNEFISLVTFVRGVSLQAHPVAAAMQPNVPDAALRSAPPAEAVEFGPVGTLHDLTLLRLAAFEAFERAKAILLGTLADEVLGRELALAPAEIDTLVARALARFREVEPISIAVAPCDADRLTTPLPVRVDPTLEAGDFVIDVKDGALESRFEFRFRGVLDRAAADSL